MPQVLVCSPSAADAKRLACLIVAAGCCTAQAQTATTPAETPPAAAAPTETVTVTATRATTATKTDTALTETPQSISVISAGDIASRGAIGLQEALRYSAGLRTEPNGADYRFDYVTARGGFEAADYLDGMRRPTSFSSATTSART